MSGAQLRVAVPLTILVIAAVLRFLGLSEPGELVWDEHYYVLDASAYLGGADLIPVGKPPAARIASEATWVHPPLGKWLIAVLGVGPFGEAPPGDRLPSALFGLVGVLLVYLLGLELWRSVWWAGLASLLVATDGMHVVQSRLATLDIIVTTLATAGILFVVRDRRRREHGPAVAPGRLTGWLGSRNQLCAGLCFGAAVATKWSGALLLLAGVALASAWRRVGAGRAGISLVLAFVIVPLTVYIASYGAFWYQRGPDVPGFLRLQTEMWREQSDHPQVQTENSPPWTWPLLIEPIRYWPPPDAAADRAAAEGRIVLLGNPVLFWGFLVVLPLWLLSVARRPAWQDSVPIICYAVAYLPWFVLARSQFLYYLLPAVPFMALGLVAGLRRVGDARSANYGRLLAAGAVALAVAFAPLWLGIPVPAAWQAALHWLPNWPWT